MNEKNIVLTQNEFSEQDFNNVIFIAEEETKNYVLHGDVVSFTGNNLSSPSMYQFSKLVESSLIEYLSESFPGHDISISKRILLVIKQKNCVYCLIEVSGGDLTPEIKDALKKAINYFESKTIEYRYGDPKKLELNDDELKKLECLHNKIEELKKSKQSLSKPESFSIRTEINEPPRIIREYQEPKEKGAGSVLVSGTGLNAGYRSAKKQIYLFVEDEKNPNLTVERVFHIHNENLIATLILSIQKRKRVNYEAEYRASEKRSDLRYTLTSLSLGGNAVECEEPRTIS